MVSVPQMPCTIAFSTEARPSVSMMTEITGSPIIRRSRTRSISTPSVPKNASVRMNAAHSGTR